MPLADPHVNISFIGALVTVVHTCSYCSPFLWSSGTMQVINLNWYWLVPWVEFMHKIVEACFSYNSIWNFVCSAKTNVLWIFGTLRFMYKHRVVQFSSELFHNQINWQSIIFMPLDAKILYFHLDVVDVCFCYKMFWQKCCQSCHDLLCCSNNYA